MVTLTRPLQVVLVAAWAVLLAQAATVVLVDSNTHSVLRHVKDVQLDARSLALVDATLLRLQPPRLSSGASAAKVSQLFPAGTASHKILEHPTAFLSVNLNGLEQGDLQLVLPTLEADKYSVLDVGSDASSEGLSVLSELQGLASINQDVPFHRLDRFKAQGCRDGCLAKALKGVAKVVGGEYSEPSLYGKLKLGSAELDLMEPDARLFAIELAQFYHAAGVALSSSQLDVLVMDVVFSNLAAVAETQGAAAAGASVKAILKVVAWIQAQYESSSKGHLAYQIALLGKASVAEVEEAMQPRVVTRRLQAPAGNASDQAAKQAAKFSNHAACYGAAFLLVYFTFAGIYCLTSMEFKQDTLLYSKGKVD